MHSTPKLVSLVAPFYNEGAGVAEFCAAMQSVMAGLLPLRCEVVCVDDGSRDDTLQRLIGLTQQDARFRVLELSRNFGKEAALTAGIDCALGDAVIPLDADLQDPPELIAQMVARWQQGAEVVLARRIDRSSDSYLKRTTANWFYRFHNRLSDLKIPENVGDFRLMDRTVVDALKQLPERQRFMKGLLAWLGFRTVVVDYIRPGRAMGESKFSAWKLWNLAIEGITSFSTAPLRIWTYLGGIGAVVAMVYAAYIVARTLMVGTDVPGYASLLVVMLFFGSLQLIGIGILGEYLGRTYIESKQRPVYLIRQRYGALAEANSVEAAQARKTAENRSPLAE